MNDEIGEKYKIGRPLRGQANQAWERARNRHDSGIGERGAAAAAQEANFDALDGISYTKGCYTGQETVARVHFRGHVNRNLRGVQSAAAIPSGAELFEGEKPVGTVKSSVVSPRMGPIGLAMIRREVETGAEVTARWEGGEGSARVREIPFG